MGKLILAIQFVYSLYIILDKDWAIQMNGAKRNNEVFACRQTKDSLWITSYSSFLDTNFKNDWNLYKSKGFTIDTITLNQNNFFIKID